MLQLLLLLHCSSSRCSALVEGALGIYQQKMQMGFVKREIEMLVMLGRSERRKWGHRKATLVNRQVGIWKCWGTIRFGQKLGKCARQFCRPAVLFWLFMSVWSNITRTMTTEFCWENFSVVWSIAMVSPSPPLSSSIAFRFVCFYSSFCLSLAVHLFSLFFYF